MSWSDPTARQVHIKPLGEALAVWGLIGLELAAVLVTYSRIEPAQLYHVDEAGDLAGGLSRALTVLNFPLSLAVIGVAGVVGGPPWLVGTAIALCATTAIPGVVDEGDFDARLVNVVPALGVALALVLTVRAVRRDGAAFVARSYGDPLRIVLAAALLVLALPWLAAETGFYLPGDFFLGEEVPRDRDTKYTAVHYGFHHGFGGVLLALTALVLSRVPAGRALRAALSLMLAYGLANAVQDSWNEQLWKRYTVDWEIPSMFRPEPSWGWLAIVLGTAVIYVLWFRPARANGPPASAVDQPSSSSSASSAS